MTTQQQSALLNDLVPAGEIGDVDEVKEVMSRNFDHLHTARSFFCVTDERYEKPFLPESGDFLGRGYLHSFLASLRLMTVKNQGEGEGFQYTYACG